ncbi:MAG: hypothetical protein B1H03_01790 [Planctomycetales bacterium 4484_113]|nr:MAG: hypothetical protein B1H03_01790 [Planctomycetales bacterium 4484_113]
MRTLRIETGLAAVSLLSLLLAYGSLAGCKQDSIRAIVGKAKPAVVMIIAKDAAGEVIAQGTGFFISADGHIVTSRHVMVGADLAEVKTAEGKTYVVTGVLAEDEGADIIEVAIEGGERISAGFPFLPLASALPAEGERVVVIGSPFALESTVSDGLVSAVREMPSTGQIIQITAPISPGSSGSPVLNLQGEVLWFCKVMAQGGQRGSQGGREYIVVRVLPSADLRLLSSVLSQLK